MAPKLTKKELQKLEEGLQKREQALEAKEADLKSWEESLEKQNSELEAGIKDLHKREKALAGQPGAAVVAADEPELSTADKKLIAAAVGAYKIADEFVFSAGINKATGQAVILTNGGSKVMYAQGDEKAEDFTPLTQIQITGINPDAKKRKPIAGKVKK